MEEQPPSVNRKTQGRRVAERLVSLR